MTYQTTKVNRHITITATDDDDVAHSNRPGTITAVTDADTVDARVGHHGETYTAITRNTDWTYA